MRDMFFELAGALFARLSGGEIASLTLRGERSSFARVSRARVRQAGEVDQDVAQLTLIRGARHASFSQTLSGQRGEDLGRLESALSELREALEGIPEDPYLLYDTHPRESVSGAPHELPDAREAVARVLALGAGHDLVGVWASGTVHRGFASSLGHRLFHESGSAQLDFSVYAERDKAVKSMYAATRFDDRALEAAIASAASKVAILRRPEKRIDPGAYRVFLAPSALTEIVGLVAWDAFGAKSQRTKQTALLHMLEGATLDARVSLADDAASGVAPPFLAAGFPRPERVPMIVEGRLAGALVSPRSAREYDLSVNANASEQPSSLVMAAGDLPERDVLARLGTGIYVTDAWYTNYSDRSAGRITGMTRFATSWVEDGEIVAPLAVMRFDDTLYRMLGGELEALTAERQWLPDRSTYGERGTDSMLLPGALIRSMSFTL